MTASTYSHRVVLWVDDDGPERFLYEEFMLERNGWTVRWANSVAEAKERLRSECFDAMLLDHFLPLQSPATEDGTDAWGGCRLLYWLRGLRLPAGVPETAVLEECAVEEGAPREENRNLKVVIVSALFDDEIDAAIRHLPGAIPTLRKPIWLQELKDHLI
jgi:CheY-like chemotaxis protein